MALTSELLSKFQQQRPYVDYISARAKDLVLAIAEQKGYAFAGRTKTVESVSEKIDSGRYASWSDIDDAYACTLVIPTLSQEPLVIERLRSDFIVQEVRSRAQSRKDPTVFRFDATRVICTLRNMDAPIADVRFEVQIRTAFEHAWSVTTHALAYKGIEVDWRQLRLAAQLKASVEQLDLMVAGYSNLTELISSQGWGEIDAKIKVQRTLKEAFLAGTFPEELKPASWMRVCDNVYSLIRSVERANQWRPEEATEKVCAAVQTALSSAPGGVVTPSVSLSQYCLGAVAQAGLVAKGLPKYTAPVSEALEVQFPAARNLVKRFNWEL